MKTRLGKIAQLPKSIRDDLNHRLENGKQGPELLEWLNGLPETQELIAQKFDNHPVTLSNLSDWRHGGFLDWRADQLREARIKRICETGETLEQAETGDLFENFARITIAEMITDLDALQKLRGEKRSDRLRNLVRDLARLQNAYNRSRWAALAWTKHNGTENGRTVSPVRSDSPSQLPTPNPQLLVPNSQLLTPSPVAPIVPDRAESQAVPLEDPDSKPNGNNMYVLHFTNCNCNDPCPKCHAPDSDYPHGEAVRDHNFLRKYNHYPRNRHGKERFLINVVCDCACDRCADKTNPGRAALPRCPIINHAEVRDEIPTAETTSPPPLTTPLPSPIRQTSPIPPIQLTDFARRMALLKSTSQ